MEVPGGRIITVGLAVTFFNCAKDVRDRIKLVASEKAALLAALTEYETDISLLESLYNDNKELFDQQSLFTDLKETGDMIYHLNDWLNSINPNLGRKNLPGLEELWKSGDLHEKLVATNAQIGSVRTRWQRRLHACTLVSTNVIFPAQTEATALLQQVVTMLQQAPVRQRSRTLSMHSHLEPISFNSEMTRVIVNTTTTIVTFSILSPDASLSYDRIKLRLEEYRTLLASDSNTIGFFTENGKALICQKQAKEIEEILDKAEILLRDVVQSHDISALVVLHHLRDLTGVLDQLKLYDECRLTGNCALDLAEALGGRSLEFKQEQAETFALIAGLFVYQPRARTLFTQAISISGEVVANSASHSSKNRLFNVLNRAGCWASGVLRAQWLGRAIQIMTKELPPEMVRPASRCAIYYSFGNCLFYLKQYAGAVVAFKGSIFIRRILARNNPARHNLYLAGALLDMGITLENHGKYDDAITALKEVLEICTTLSVPYQCNGLMARALGSHGIALWKLNRISEAAVVQKQAIPLFRNLAQTGNEHTRRLCRVLDNYGNSCYSLGQHAESVPAYQESILLRRVLAATHPEQERHLRMTLHNIANSFNALGKCVEADAAAIEALERNHGRVLKPCGYAPDFKSCFVCQRVTTGVHGKRDKITRIVQRE